MTLAQREEIIGSILASVIKENYKGVNEVDNDTGYVEEKILKIFEKVKLANMDLKDEDRYNSCFITNQDIIFPYADLVGKSDTDEKDYYTYIINLAAHCLMRDKACSIISLYSILDLKELHNIIAILYKSISFTTISKKKGFTKLYINTIDFNKDNTITDINLIYNKSVEHNLIPFDAILALDDYGIKNSNIIDEIINSSINWSSINLYQNILPFLKELKAFAEEQEIIVTFFSISGKTLSNFINAKKEGIEEFTAYRDDMIYGGYVSIEKMEHDLAAGAAYSQEILKVKHGKQQVKEGTVNANEMTSILSCNPPNSLAYSFDNPPKYSTIVFITDYKISETLEVKDIDKQVAATYMENKNVICIYNDKKEKSNSYEAILNTEIVNSIHETNGHGKLELYISGYGADKDEAVKDLDTIYNNIINQFNNLYKTK